MQYNSINDNKSSIFSDYKSLFKFNEIDEISIKKVELYNTKIIYNYDENLDYNNDLYDIIILNLLQKVFPDIAKPEMTTQKILKEVENRTGYLILEIKEINNYASKIMYEARRKASFFDNNNKTVFHGTTPDNAEKICENGFLLQEIRRALFGVGIYTAAHFFLALYYAKPNKDNYNQTVIVADLLEGSTAVGTKGQTDFGRDSNNNPIMTLTDENKGILCSRGPENINVRYTFTVRYKNIKDYKTCMEIPTHLHNLKYFHPDIYNIIKNNIYLDQTKNIPKSTSVVPIATINNALISAPLFSQVASSSTFTHVSSKTPKETKLLDQIIFRNTIIMNGSTVIINNTYKEYRCLSLSGKTGTVKYITTDDRTLVYILMHDENDRENIKKKNIEVNNKSRMNKLTIKNTPDLTEEKTKEFNELFCVIPNFIKLAPVINSDSSINDSSIDNNEGNDIDGSIVNNDSSINDSGSKNKRDDDDIETSNKRRKVNDEDLVIVID